MCECECECVGVSVWVWWKGQTFKDTVEAKLANGLLNEIKTVAVSLLKVHY